MSTPADGAPFSIGDKVTTDFYKKDRALIRTVTKVYRPGYVCESGWLVETIDELRRILACDANWYRKAGVK